MAQGLVKFEETEKSLQKMIDSKSLPVHIKTVEQAYLIANMGKELNFPIVQAFHYIIPIQGRLTLSAKAIGAILRTNKVKIKTLADAYWVYSDGSTNRLHAEKEGGPKVVDRVTTLLFTRGEEEEEVSFYWTDAVAAGLTTKDNWKRMPKEMMYARCLSKGANRIGQDLLLGMYMTDEIVDSLNSTDGLKITRDEDGFIENVEETEYTEA